jgi:hypothetical protein
MMYGSLARLLRQFLVVVVMARVGLIRKRRIYLTLVRTAVSKRKGRVWAKFGQGCMMIAHVHYTSHTVHARKARENGSSQ